MTHEQIVNFVRESNHIERIFRDGTDAEIEEFKRFVALDMISVEDLERFVAIYQPEAKLRDKFSMNVKVGSYYPPFGHPDMKKWVKKVFSDSPNAWSLHNNFENLHPFTDCNGRTGRALWAWKMKEFEGSFLLNYYFQTLQKMHRGF